MRLPNGFGNVSKLSGKRRYPWRARATCGWEITKKGTKQLYVNLGCYEKKIHGIQVLTAYNNDPDIFVGLLELYKKGHIVLDDLFALRLPKTSPEKIIKNIENVGITFKQLYKLWLADESKYGGAKKTDKRKYNYAHAYKLCTSIEYMLVIDVNLAVMQKLVNDSGENKNRLSMLKQLFKVLFVYAEIHNIITKEDNKVEFLDLSNAAEPNKNPSKRFSSAEIETLWKATLDDDVDEFIYAILMLIYTGLRVSEMVDLEKTDVFINERYLRVVDSKTKAGIRVVPIAEKVIPFFNYWLQRGNNSNLISGRRGDNIGHAGFRSRHWERLMNEFGFDHKIHDTRHTCVSLLKTANVNDVWIKQIVGHKSQNLTDNTYTEIEIEPLIEAINLI